MSIDRLFGGADIGGMEWNGLANALVFPTLHSYPRIYPRIYPYLADIWRGYIPKNIRGYIPEDISFFLGIYPPRGYIRGYIPKGGYIPQKKGYILGDISSGIYPRKGIYPFPKGIYPTLKRIGYIPERGYIPFPKGIYLTLKRIGYVCGLGYIRDISPHSRGYITWLMLSSTWVCS
jgi:hypothetical protein